MEEQLDNEPTFDFDTTDAKNRGESSQFELDELLQLRNVNPYGTLDRDIFASKVETMTLDEMRVLAARIGLTPINRQETLRGRLLDSFSDYVLKYRATQKPKGTSVDPNSEAYKSIEHLL